MLRKKMQPNLRIVAGEYSSRRINTFVGNMNTRPTADRVRENMFNILQAEIAGSVALDLFSGTGAIGIEALSRGASRCDFVESDDEAVQLIKVNLELLKVPESRYRIFHSDVSTFLSSAAPPSTIQELYTLVFADPPYASQWYSRAVRDVFGSKICSKNCILCIEMDGYTDLGDQANESWVRNARRSYGKTSLEIWRNFED